MAFALFLDHTGSLLLNVIQIWSGLGIGARLTGAGQPNITLQNKAVKSCGVIVSVRFKIKVVVPAA